MTKDDEIATLQAELLAVQGQFLDEWHRAERAEAAIANLRREHQALRKPPFEVSWHELERNDAAFLVDCVRRFSCAFPRGYPENLVLMWRSQFDRLESATPQNAGATKPEGSQEVGAHTSSSLSSSRVRSSSSLRTLVEQLLTALKAASQFLDPEVSRGPAIYGWQNSVDLVEAAIAKADELAALLSPVEGRQQLDSARIADIRSRWNTVKEALRNNEVDVFNRAHHAQWDDVEWLLAAVEGRQGEDHEDDQSRSPSDGCASATGSPRKPLPEGSRR